MWNLEAEQSARFDSGIPQRLVPRTVVHPSQSMAGRQCPKLGFQPTAVAVWLMKDQLEEPDVRSTSPVLWELGAGNRPWLPDARGIIRIAYSLSASYGS